MNGPDKVRLFRPTAFRLGLAAGIAASLVAIWLIPEWPRKPAAPSPFNVEIASSGGDLTGHGARRLVVRSGHGALIQDCNDGCDDLRDWVSTDENVFRVQATDPSGKGLVVDGGTYIPAGHRVMTHIEISGPDALKIGVSSKPLTATTAEIAPTP